MCSFFGIKTDNPELLEFLKNNQEKIFRKLKYRGPDIHRVEEIEKNFILAGFVLAINDFVPQPIEKDGAWLVWNGEIYNCPKKYSNDSQYLIEIFNSQGTEVIFNYQDNGNGSLVSEIDGEYAICYYNKGFLHIITDDFFTKPLCYSLTDRTLIFSSYESAINELDSSLPVIHALPNTYYVFDTNSYQLVSQREVYKWDFEPRHNTFEFWNQAFEESVKKRINTDKKVFLPLSSGYDSGAICCEVLRQNFPCTMYSYLGVENQEILKQRFQLIAESENSNSIIVNPEEDFDTNFKEFYEKAENFVGYHYDGTPYIDIFQAYSCFGHYIICRDAKQKGYDICLSGHGSDEIYSDYYSPNTKAVSILRGNYNNVRKKWPNFDMGYGRNILGMFERTAGACGIETRYPFLDRNAVQNFLWLSDELKNSNYKQCLHQLMSARSFPFDDVNFKNALRIFKGDRDQSRFNNCLKNFYNKNSLNFTPWLQEVEIIIDSQQLQLSNFNNSWIRLATYYKNYGQLTLAIILYRKCIDLLPNFYLPHQLLAEALEKNGDINGACQAISTAIKINPKSLICRMMLQKLQTRSSNTTNKHSATLKLQEDSFYKNSLNDVIYAYYHLVMSNELSNSGYIFYNLGCLLVKNENFNEAVVWLKKAAQVKSDIVKLDEILGVALFQIGHLDEAEEYLSNALNSSLPKANAYYYLGEIKFKKELYLEAAKLYKSAIKNTALSQYYLKLGQVLVQLGKAHIDRGRLQEAVNSYRQAIELNPYLPEGYYFLGQVLVDLAIWKEALVAYRKAVQLLYSGVEVYYQIAYCLVRLGQWTEAAIEYQRANRLHLDVLAKSNNDIFSRLNLVLSYCEKHFLFYNAIDKKLNKKVGSQDKKLISQGIGLLVSNPRYGSLTPGIAEWEERWDRSSGKRILMYALADYSGSMMKWAQAINTYTDFAARLVIFKSHQYGYDEDIVVPKPSQVMPLTGIDNLIAEADIIHIKDEDGFVKDENGWVNWNRLPPSLLTKFKKKPTVFTHYGGYARMLAQNPTYISFVKSFDARVAMTPDLCFDWFDGYFIPHAIDTVKFKYSWTDGNVVAHSPSTAARKGTKDFIRAVEEIDRVKVDLISGVRHYECVQRKSKCSLFFDQAGREIQEVLGINTIIGWYGNSALESAVFGIPTIAHLSKEAFEGARRGGKDIESVCGIINTPLGYEDIRETILTFMNMTAEEKKEVSLKTRKWIEDFHSYQATAQELSKVYKSLL